MSIRTPSSMPHGDDAINKGEAPFVLGVVFELTLLSESLRSPQEKDFGGICGCYV